MNKIVSYFTKRLFSYRTSHKSKMNNEPLYSLAKSCLAEPLAKEQVRDYLHKHFERTVTSVQDFPEGLTWINTSQPLSLHRDLKGKVVLLDFFTYCCINCMHILPDLKKLEKKYSVESGLVVIGVHCAKFDNEKETKNISSAIKRHEVEHAVMNDCKGIVWNAFDVNCWPTLVLIGPKGEILLSLSGEGHFDLLDNLIQLTLDVAKELNILSNNSLPQIHITDDLKPSRILSFPGKVTSYSDENIQLLAISDTGHHRILIVDSNGSIQFTIGGTESGFHDAGFNKAKFKSPQGLVFLNESIIYVADTENHAIREVNLITKMVTTVAGTGQQGNDRIGGKLWQQQAISSPWDVSFGKNYNVLLIAMAGHHQIWALYLQDVEQNFFKKGKKGQCKAIAGSGREENRNNCYPHAAAFAQPSGLTYCSERDSVFIADSESSSIRELNLIDGKVSSVVGGSRNPANLFCFGDSDGIGYNVKLQHVLGVAWHPEEKLIYAVDSYNHKLKKIGVEKNSCTTVNLNELLDEPAGVCVLQGKIFITDTNNHIVKVFDPNSSLISTLEIKSPRPSFSIPITAEKDLSISKNGGTLKVNIVLNLAEGISVTKDAPAFWLISFADEQFTQTNDPETKEQLHINSQLVINVPEFFNKSTINVLIKGNLYICKGDICSLEQLLFIIRLSGVNQHSDNIFYNFSHILNK